VYVSVTSRGSPGADPVTGWFPVIRHRCDEPSCQAAGHLAAGSAADNSHDYVARRQDPYSPLKDRRGPRGRDRWAPGPAPVFMAASAARRRGPGTALGGGTTRRVFDHGIEFTLFRVWWPGTLRLERQIQARCTTARYVPVARAPLTVPALAPSPG